MIPEILIIVLLTAVLVAFAYYFFLSRKAPPGSVGDIKEKGETETPCPLCQKFLHRGERVHSQVYSRGEDRLMNIYGCPWCYKDHPAGAHTPLRERRCPSCGTLLKEGSFAVARVFERPGRKTHVHVLGCPVCRNRK